MEAALLDMTRSNGIPMFVFSVFDPTLEVDIEVVGDDDEYDVVIEYVFERAPIEEAFADPWFANHDDTSLALDENLPIAPIASPRSLHAVLGIAAAVALATGLYAATL